MVPSAPDTARPAAVLRLTAALVLTGLPGIVGRGVVAALSAATPASAAGAYGAFLGATGPALLAALVAVSATVLVNGPGVLLVLLSGAARTAPQWLAYAAVASLGVNTALVLVLERGLGVALHGAGFGAALVATTAALGALAAWTAGRRDLAWPARPGTAFLGLGALFCALGVLLLGPKIFWESFNGDGAHAHEVARLLLTRAVPFFGPDAGGVENFPDARSWLFALPASWFLRLFGDLAAASRLAMFPHLVAAAAGIVAAAEYRRRPLRGTEVAAVWVALAVFTLALGFSGTYSAYHADLGLPLTQDTQVVACLLMLIAAWWSGDTAWMLAGAFCTLAALPNGGILVVMLGLAATVVWRDAGRPSVVRLAVALVAAMVLLAIGARLLPFLGLPQPGTEYGALQSLRRYRYVTVFAPNRLGWAILPAGILPAAAALLWRRLDGPARTLAATCALYFAAVYFQGSAVLHHFVPVMLLLIPVLWRSPLGEWLGRGPSGLATFGAASLVAAVFCWPATVGPHLDTGQVGAAIDIRLPGYADSAAGWMRGVQLLNAIVPTDIEDVVPAQSFGTSQLALAYHAARRDPSAAAAFVLQPAAAPPPEGFPVRLEATAEHAVYARDEAAVADARNRRPPSPAGSPWLSRPRGEMFGRMATAPAWRYLDLLAVAHRLGVARLIPGAETAR
ncbi:MAG: hypothetical protein AB7O28_01915 [Vicinamibacterales bacterium]